MGLIARAIASPFRIWNTVRDEVAKERRLTLTDGLGWSQFSGRSSSSGKIVTQENALQLSAVWACIKITAQAVSSLPLTMYEKRPDDDRREVDDPIAQILTESPNEDQTPLEFWEGVTAWLLTNGNAYAEKVESRQTLIALQPLSSSHCRPFRKPDGQLVYRFSDRGKIEELPRDKVFHVKGFGQSLHNMDMGLSPIASGTNAIGSAMAAQEAAATNFSNGMLPSGFFMFDQQLTPDQRINARKHLIDPLTGSSKSGSVGILEAGTKWQSVSLNPEDVQMLETRRFDIEEICRWFGVPPIVIGHSPEGQTMWGSGVEQLLLAWLTLGIDPICDRIEARIKKQLIRPTGKRNRYAEFNREALLQMDSKAKAEFLSKMVQNGIIDRNEGRARLNMSKREGADVLTAQTNLAPIDQLGATDEQNQLRQALQAFLQPQQKGDGDEQA